MVSVDSNPNNLPLWSYVVTNSPFGSVLIAEQNGRITHLLVGEYAALDQLKVQISRYRSIGADFSLLSRKTKILSETEKQFQEYSEGKRKQFTLPLAPCGTLFQLKVWSALCEVSYGERITYGELANKIGVPKSARAVGGAVHRNPIAVIIPCHRVVAKNGLGGFAVGIEIKKRLLARETG